MEAYVRQASLPAADSGRAAVVNALRADLRSEIRAVKVALGRTQSADGGATSDLAAEVFAMRSAIEQLALPAPKNRRVTSLLKSRGIEGRAATDLSRSVKNLPEAELQDGLRQHVTQMLSAAQWPLPAPGTRSLIAAVGMSGVGKTTTLAKLATMARAAKLRVSLVTSDTFRVGGIEQLQRYAKLLDSPFATVRSMEELDSLLERTDADVVILDTSGRPAVAGAPEQLLREEAFARSSACRALTRHVLLCMPASIREIDVSRSIGMYAFAHPNALAFTKLDETLHPSGIVHAALASKLPIALTCSGPRVPEDIMKVDINYIVNQVFPAGERTKARAA